MKLVIGHGGRALAVGLNHLSGVFAVKVLQFKCSTSETRFVSPAQKLQHLPIIQFWLKRVVVLSLYFIFLCLLLPALFYSPFLVCPALHFLPVFFPLHCDLLPRPD